MRRKGFGIAVIALVLAFVVPQGAVSGKKGRQRVTCHLAPFAYQLGGNPESRPEAYEASGSTLLTCPEGHPLNGAQVTVEVLDAQFSFGAAGGMTQPASVRGRATYSLQGIYTESVSFAVKIRGTASPDGNGGSTLDLNIRGRASDGAKLRLHEIGTLAPFDQGGALVSLATVSVNPRDGTFTGT